jgi:gentisate 1,2-dioxygenase
MKNPDTYEKPDYMKESRVSRTAAEMRDSPTSTPDYPFLKKDQIEWRWIEERNHANAYIKHPTKTVMAILEEVPPGEKPTSLHRHAVEAVYYVLQGTGRSRVGKNVFEWEPGDSFYVGPFEWHQHWTLGDEPARFFACTNAALINLVDCNLFEERGVTTTWEEEHDEKGNIKEPTIIDKRY